MQKILIILILGSSILYPDSNDTNQSKEKTKIQKEIKKQIEKEKKYAKEKTFYQGENYDLKAYEIDPDNLPDVPSLEPDYDFDMSEGVYD